MGPEMASWRQRTRQDGLLMILFLRSQIGPQRMEAKLAPPSLLLLRSTDGGLPNGGRAGSKLSA